MQEARKTQLLAFCEQLQIEIHDLDLLDMALTHSSYAHEAKSNPKPKYNERIEFLGDSVLSIIVSTYMYNNYPKLAEGDLTKIRAYLVCESSLYELAQKIQLGKNLLLGRGEELSGGRERASILADAFESILGAIYLDRGFEYVQAFLLNIMQTKIDDVCIHGIFSDFKSSLQEYLQGRGEADVLYREISSSGPEHNKTFNCEVLLNGVVIGAGSGHRKKDAEQNAAKSALEKYNVIPK